MPKAQVAKMKNKIRGLTTETMTLAMRYEKRSIKSM